MKADRVYRLQQTSNVFLIDVRNKIVHKRERIVGSISYPYTPHEYWADDLINVCAKTDTIVTYCDAHICSLGKYAARALQEKGYLNVFTLSGGIDEWKRQGYPVESSY